MSGTNPGCERCGGAGTYRKDGPHDDEFDTHAICPDCFVPPMSEAEKDTREWTLIYCPDCGKHLDVTDDWRICPRTHFRHRRASQTVVPKS